jgi:hypothetical protein
MIEEDLSFLYFHSGSCNLGLQRISVTVLSCSLVLVQMYMYDWVSLQEFLSTK